MGEEHRCPTSCDADCDADCHELHQPRWKRDHEPAGQPDIRDRLNALYEDWRMGRDCGPTRVVCTLFDALAEIDELRAECERHRRANLVRAVTQGLDPEWVSEIIAAEGFDAVPWRIAAAALGEKESGA